VGACEILDRENAPIQKIVDSNGNPITIKVPIMDPPINLEVWRVLVGKTRLYLIDTSSEANESGNRVISDRLYTGDLERRLRQEIVLGIGGVRILEAMRENYSVLHLNEGHPAFAVLERIRMLVEKGMNYSDAFEQVKSTTVFTTHTPVPAGHDIFTHQLLDKYFDSYLPTLDLPREEFFRQGMTPLRPDDFNMTAFALRTSKYHNAVSKKHGEVSRKMWQQLWPGKSLEEVPIDYNQRGPRAILD
jgi:starch phosphorylase